MTPEERGRLVAVAVEEHIRQAVAEPQTGWNHMANFLGNVAHGVYVMSDDGDDAEPLLLPRGDFFEKPFGEWPAIVRKAVETHAKQKKRNQRKGPRPTQRSKAGAKK